MSHLNRITHDPRVMGGKACIRGMRVTVSMILGQLAEGHPAEELLADYPYLEADDLTAALHMPHGSPVNAKSASPSREFSEGNTHRLAERSLSFDVK